MQDYVQIPRREVMDKWIHLPSRIYRSSPISSHFRGAIRSYLYRAVDSTGATIDFLLSETRDLTAARNFFQKALASPGHPRPRVITVDGNPSYPTVIDELKQQRAFGRRCYCRVVPYLNNIVEQDHRAIKRRVNACLGFRSFDDSQRTIQGYEAMNIIRKGQSSMVSKG